MLILALDTSGAYVSVALVTPDTVVASAHVELDRGQGEALMPMIVDMMTKSGYQMTDLTGVAVAVGPGSFTGVRIALAAARGLGLALKIPVLGVTNLEAAAWHIYQPVTVILDTKRGDYYTQSFDATGHPVSAAKIQSVADLKQSLPFVTVGNGAGFMAQETGCSVADISAVSAVAVGYIALSRWENPMPAEPLYLRDADVTLSR